MAHHRRLVITMLVAVVVFVVGTATMAWATNDTNEPIEDDLAVDSSFGGLGDPTDDVFDRYWAFRMKNYGAGQWTVDTFNSAYSQCLRYYGEIRGHPVPREPGAVYIHALIIDYGNPCRGNHSQGEWELKFRNSSAGGQRVIRIKFEAPYGSKRDPYATCAYVQGITCYDFTSHKPFIDAQNVIVLSP
jgi:hypothetical protein